MTDNINIEPISVNINNQTAIVMYILISIIIAISIGQIIYRIIKKKKSAIIWILIGLFIPTLLPNLLGSEIIKIFAKEMFSGDIISLIGAVFLFAGVGASISIIYNKSVLFLDNKTK